MNESSKNPASKIIHVSDLIKQSIDFPLTEDQLKCVYLLDTFVEDESKEKKMFILKGYAGTGKTRIISEFVKVLPALKIKFILLAPTGRAAKILSKYSSRAAFTIHKIIYDSKNDSTQLFPKFALKKNSHKNTIYIIDETSMLSDIANKESNGVLTDLIQYVFENPSNRILFIGDIAQLPPVHTELSPALDSHYLKNKFSVSIIETELQEVVRQNAQSGILHNATLIRNAITTNNLFPQLHTQSYKDIFKIYPHQLDNGLQYAHKKYGKENTVIICLSNKQALVYNTLIRKNIYAFQSEIEVEDTLLITKNNYFYSKNTKLDFLANGDFVRIVEIQEIEYIYDLHFATVVLELLDYPHQEPFECKIILDSLKNESSHFSYESYQALFQKVFEDYRELADEAEREEYIKNNEYLNAIEVKFAYAITCHKAQGGQWKSVFIEKEFVSFYRLNKTYLRWLYTALTRATDEVFLLNFEDTFFV
ncbi:MAG: AAA family ATPase [Chitinophagaceae bacterium]|nr:AAA family ATPase [Chitinophagaceae bacterium]